MYILFLTILEGELDFFGVGGGRSGVRGGVGLGLGWRGWWWFTPPPFLQHELYLQSTDIAHTCNDKNVWNAMQSIAMWH